MLLKIPKRDLKKCHPKPRKWGYPVSSLGDQWAILCLLQSLWIEIDQVGYWDIIMHPLKDLKLPIRWDLIIGQDLVATHLISLSQGSLKAIATQSHQTSLSLDLHPNPDRSLPKPTRNLAPNQTRENQPSHSMLLNKRKNIIKCWCLNPNLIKAHSS